MPNNQEKLQAIIEYGVERGFDDKDDRHRASMGFGGAKPLKFDAYYGLLFNHDFAEAIWGDTVVFRDKGKVYDGRDKNMKLPPPNWQYHLQQAVISDDPIDYYYQAVIQYIRTNMKKTLKQFFLNISDIALSLRTISRDLLEIKKQRNNDR